MYLSFLFFRLYLTIIEIILANTKYRITAIDKTNNELQLQCSSLTKAHYSVHCTSSLPVANCVCKVTLSNVDSHVLFNNKVA